MGKRFDLLVFDWDGTLVDSAQHIVGSIQAAARDLGLAMPPDERARETMAQNLRRAAGINRRAFHEQTGIELEVLTGPALARHVELAFLADDGSSVRLTRQGKFVADAVTEALWCG